MTDFALRQFDSATDTPYVLSSWVRTCRGQFPWRHCTDKDWNVQFRERALAVLERSQCLVACDPEDASVIYGFAVFEPEALHFVYVKGAFRGFGIGKALTLAACPTLGTCQTVVTWVPPLDALAKYKLEFRPFDGPMGVKS